MTYCPLCRADPHGNEDTRRLPVFPGIIPCCWRGRCRARGRGATRQRLARCRAMGGEAARQRLSAWQRESARQRISARERLSARQRQFARQQSKRTATMILTATSSAHGKVGSHGKVGLCRVDRKGARECSFAVESVVDRSLPCGSARQRRCRAKSILCRAGSSHGNVPVCRSALGHQRFVLAAKTDLC